MERKDFLKKGLLGTGMLVTNAALGGVLRNDIDELKELEVMGLNHLPNPQTWQGPFAVLHRAHTRGHASHGWLDSHQTFSFANYYNPDSMHFGVLRVLNDDRIDASKGFGRHPHDNMEIISIPLEGDLEHKDSLGNTAVIRAGDIQVMSAGTGVFHSEYNKNDDREARFLQIWVFPRQRNVEPRYDQLTLDIHARKNKLQQILSPNPGDEGVWIHQDAWFHMGRFDKDISVDYSLKKKDNGIYVFVINGSVQIDDVTLDKRDGLGIWNISGLSLQSLSDDTEILIMEIPMTIS
ncbi:pirin family protein [Terrimonas ferruginea]|uniref:pirin family protein n=1 Tax=Terrimonas ferruginea TaxID=249 RepID=UPI0004206B42|nr:pirin family protein [Terrimonas ferruginea]